MRNRTDHDQKAVTSRDTEWTVDLFPNSDSYTSLNGHRSRDITNFITEITIEEGLSQSSLLATLTIRDGVNLIDDMRIAGNEKIIINIRQEHESGDNQVSHVFYISDVINFSRKLQVQTYQFICVSMSAYLNNLIVLNRAFKDSPGNLIQKILKSDLKVPSNNIFIRGAGGIIQGIYPNLRPINAINWLIRNAFDGQEPFYFFESLHYEDGSKKKKGSRGKSKGPTKKGGLVFDSYKKFLSLGKATTRGGPDLKLSHIPYQRSIRRNKKKTFQESKERILKISTNLGMSKFNQIPKGAFGSTFLGVDIATKKLIPDNKGHVYKYHQSDKYPRLNKYPSFAMTKRSKFLDKTLSEYQGQRFFSSLNSSAFEDIGNYSSALEKHYEPLQHSTSIKENLNYLTHIIQVEGNFNMWPGKVLEIRMPKAADPEYLQGVKTEHDEILSGNFMITHLVHSFKGGQYIINATCAKDSSMISLDSPPPKPNTGM